MRKFMEEVTLLGQPFVKDPDQTVEKLLKQAGAGVRRFARVEVGEGLEKRNENFADEVMASEGLTPVRRVGQAPVGAAAARPARRACPAHE